MPKNKSVVRLSSINGNKSGFISIAEAAEYLGVNPRTIRMMIADGRLTAYRNGPRVIRLRRDEIDSSMVPFGGAV